MIHGGLRGASRRWARTAVVVWRFDRLRLVDTYLFSGYARLPQDVSHQALYSRVGVVVEVDEKGTIVACSSTLLMDLARDFLDRLLRGRSVLNEREAIEAALRQRYRGHSQGALIFALRKVFEMVDQSPLVAGGAAAGQATAPGPAPEAHVDGAPGAELHRPADDV
jgi:hypothetical protein